MIARNALFNRGILLTMAVNQSGCTNVLAFGTATKFALDVSQRADQIVDVSLGYDRAEIASIPTPKNQDATVKDNTPENGDDTYSVLGTFSVVYGNPFRDEPLVLDQFFATGWAARIAAKNPQTRKYFGQAVHDIATKIKGVNDGN